jgi:hypothetical protein
MRCEEKRHSVEETIRYVAQHPVARHRKCESGYERSSINVTLVSETFPTSQKQARSCCCYTPKVTMGQKETTQKNYWQNQRAIFFKIFHLMRSSML